MTRKTIWRILVLILPVLAVLRIAVQFVFYVLTLFVEGSQSSLQVILSIKSIFNWIVWLISLFGILWLIPGIILLVKSTKDVIKDEKDTKLNLNCDGERLAVAIIDWWLHYLIIPIFFNLYYYFSSGETIGRKVMWIKIVNLDWNKPSAWSLIGRFFAKILSRLVLMLWFLWILFDKKHQWRHDKLANTLVVKHKKANPWLATLLILVGLWLLIVVPTLLSMISQEG